MAGVSFFHGRRFRPGLWPTLAALVLVTATVMLGNWQRHRAAEKDALRSQYEAARALPPLDLGADIGDPAALRYRPVRVTGRFDHAHEILIDNRIRGGRPGFDVVTPLMIAGGGNAVLVDRGWVPLGPSRAVLPSVSAVEGTVTVVGRANLPPRYVELGKTSDAGRVWQNIDIARTAAATGLVLLPLVVEQTGPAATDGLERDWPAPDFGAAQNLSYMLQWYSFAALAVVLWLALNWQRTRP